MAIAVRIFIQIILMIVFCRIEFVNGFTSMVNGIFILIR